MHTHTYTYISMTLILGLVHGTAEKGACLLHSYLQQLLVMEQGSTWCSMI